MKQCGPTLNVTGVGVVKVRPDMAQVTMSVVTEDQEAKAAQERNAEIITSVVAGLRAFGIPEDQIQTKQYTIYPEYDYSNGQQVFRHYVVNHALQVNVYDTSRIGELMDLVIGLGANRIGDVQFSLSQPDVYQYQALQLAIQNASLKASALAQTTCVKLLHPPVKIVEQYEENHDSPRPFATSLKAADIGTELNPGQILIKAKVEMWYAYS